MAFFEAGAARPLLAPRLQSRQAYGMSRTAL